MTYVAAQARQDLLDTVADAIDEIAGALAALGDAYELLDDAGADKLEEELFRPVQSAYGRAQRTHTAFAGRFGLPTRVFSPAASGAASRGVKGFVEDAVDAIEQADGTLSSLQDSLLPTEVGDPELRAGLAEVRRLIGDVPARAERYVSRFGR